MTDATKTPGRFNFFGGAVSLEDGAWFDPEKCKYRCSICGAGTDYKVPHLDAFCSNCCVGLEGAGKISGPPRGTLRIGHSFTLQADDKTIKCWYCGLLKPPEEENANHD